MKQETKKLIKGLKEWYENFRSNATLTDYTKWAIGDGEGYADEGASNMDKVIALLDKFAEVEKHLTTGGFILDHNGTPCKDGDKIKIVVRDEASDGIVSWIAHNGCFLLKSNNEDMYNWYVDELEDNGGYFEKTGE